MAYMKSRIHEFITTFSWYRNVSLKLLEQLPQEALLEQISDRSCTVSIQFTDLGDTELKVVGDIVGKDLRALVTRPALTCTSKAEIAGYLAACSAIAKKELETFPHAESSSSWYGRINFTLPQALTFIIAHEAMHHGEILSFIYAKNLPMPAILKTTWGFEAEEDSTKK